jgi:predicted nucleic-acid-binding Zn-ribbon protein
MRLLTLWHENKPSVFNCRSIPTTLEGSINLQWKKQWKSASQCRLTRNDSSKSIFSSRHEMKKIFAIKNSQFTHALCFREWFFFCFLMNAGVEIASMISFTTSITRSVKCFTSIVKNAWEYLEVFSSRLSDFSRIKYDWWGFCGMKVRF